jgi:hypothetical protein
VYGKKDTLGTSLPQSMQELQIDGIGCVGPFLEQNVMTQRVVAAAMDVQL